jgi:hypothetical protein
MMIRGQPLKGSFCRDLLTVRYCQQILLFPNSSSNPCLQAIGFVNRRSERRAARYLEQAPLSAGIVYVSDRPPVRVVDAPFVPNTNPRERYSVSGNRLRSSQGLFRPPPLAFPRKVVGGAPSLPISPGSGLNRDRATLSVCIPALHAAATRTPRESSGRS